MEIAEEMASDIAALKQRVDDISLSLPARVHTLVRDEPATAFYLLAIFAALVFVFVVAINALDVSNVGELAKTARD